MVAKILKKPNNPWNNWNLYTRYSPKRKNTSLNTVLIIDGEAVLTKKGNTSLPQPAQRNRLPWAHNCHGTVTGSFSPDGRR